jgi:pimeloyl-ACP methyl ester carboxylesterase
MKYALVLSVIVSLMSHASAVATPYPPQDQGRPPLSLKAHGIFWAGGKVVKRTQVGESSAGDLRALPLRDQDILVGQAYVEYFIPSNLRSGPNTPPIVLVPGGALVGVHFLTTPDGREGWAHYFIRKGFPVYVVDVPGRGRAGFNPDVFNNVRSGAADPKSQPELRMWDSSAWLEWNQGPLPAPSHGPRDPACIGNDARDPGSPSVYCNGDLMPARDPEGYAHWLAAHIPEGPIDGSPAAGVLAALKKIGPAIYIGHSQAGAYGGALANQNPDAFLAMIGIEPAGVCAISPKSVISGIAKVPVLTIHGINQIGRADTPPCLDAYDQIKKAGGDATYLSLPKLPRNPLFDRIPQVGIWGNGHIMMWETNSDQIADVMLEWIEKRVKAR